MSTRLRQQFSVPFEYEVIFTENIFDSDNKLFSKILSPPEGEPPKKVLFVLDEGMLRHHPELFSSVQAYSLRHPESFILVQEPVIIPGGEDAKNNPGHTEVILNAINKENIDRHSFVVCVGGGAVIDTAGYAAGIAHRGIRIVRIPTTVLSQNDAAVGVKNGVNAFGKKNFLGTFVPPFAVINDSNFLETLDERDWRSGISEALKVALLKDPDFFSFLSANAAKLNSGDKHSMEKLIHRCAELHLEHITTSGDPFEMGSSRPLDFGHWAAHKLEQLTGYELRHGEAVAIGIALDVTYSLLNKMITESEWQQILDTLKNSGFRLFVPELQNHLDEPLHKDSLLRGLQEFREHLGGKLTIMLLEGIGKGVEVNEVDFELYRRAVHKLEEYDSVNNEVLE
jgi:3-dehydroquinate synthase